MTIRNDGAMNATLAAAAPRIPPQTHPMYIAT
jgi:hypothetical protein